MLTELEAENFSAEDASNVVISCSLSATAYELLPNFTAILKSPAAKQHKIKLFELLAAFAETIPAFLCTGNRFSEHVAPVISRSIEEL